MQFFPVFSLGLMILYRQRIDCDHSPKTLHHGAVFLKQVTQRIAIEVQASGLQLWTATVPQERNINVAIGSSDLRKCGVSGGCIEALAELQHTPLLWQLMADFCDARIAHLWILHVLQKVQAIDGCVFRRSCAFLQFQLVI